MKESSGELPKKEPIFKREEQILADTLEGNFLHQIIQDLNLIF